jgi:large subunit ribosomal protein L10
VAIGADYRGLSVSDITNLRRQLRDAGVQMHVVKNTLFRLAADAAGKSEMHPLAEGPTALVLGFGDPIAPIKTVVEYQRTARNSFAARNAYFDGQIVSAGRLTEIATLPPKETMIAEFAGMLVSPVANLVGMLQATIQEFSGLIDARAEQMA